MNESTSLIGRVVAHEDAGVAVAVMGEVVILDAVEVEDGHVNRAVVPLNQVDAIALARMLIEAASRLP